ncbi:hypothetical protein K491DRAFT_661463 [Lophiostoma macrostomum CBS 122681]|uniref:Maintenance of mitochondrial morphology protein 1 n=1 Tax=Lophiostoma macrostomum CBS 122681 TaxID=1314788 RepID=A0A6A6T1G9_9PLEO|nr:hypothetical protein K491DRAFT_661463 [Lophiostoma macrostomum CBS 122681]
MAQQPLSTPQPVSQGSSLSFTQGFLLGQLSIALLIFFFIKFFIFGEPPSADERALHLSSLRRARTLAHQQQSLHSRTRSNSTTNPLRPKSSRNIIRAAAGSGGGPSISQILAKTYYNVKGHQPESLDWFNVLIAQTIAQLRDDARQDGAVLTSLTDLLNSGSKPDWIGEIRVTEIALGDEFPIFSNCRVMPAEDGFAVGGSGAGGGGGSSGGTSHTEDNRLQARMDVDLSDVITLGIETTLVLNYPKPLVAVLPVALAVSVVRFSGTLAVSFIPSSSPPSTSTHTPDSSPSPAPPTHQRQPSSARAPAPSQRPESVNGGAPLPPHRPTTLAFTFLDDYRLDLSVRSLVGSRSRLQDVPKIAQLIESRVHAWFDERAVEPRFQQIVLPSLWPRKRNTRGGEGVDGNGDEEEEVEPVTPGEVGGDGDGAVKRHSSFVPRVPPAATATTLEERIEAEGAKLRDAEVRAGERKSEGVGLRDAVELSSETERDRERDGMRWRGEREQRQPLSRQTSRNRFSGEWSGQRGMPGGMPSG